MRAPARKKFRHAELSQGRISYRESGEGPAVVFVHGLQVAADIWDETVERLLQTGLRCIQPDLPMGSHQTPLHHDADNSPIGAAALIGDLLECLGLEEAILVGNDSGGALCQILAAQRPARIAGLVLTNCDIGRVFPPFPYSVLPPLARMPGGTALMATGLKLRAVRRLAFGSLTKDPIPDEVLRRWVRPAAENSGVRRDTRKLIAAAHRSQTLEAAERLRNFNRPVLFAWGSEDRFFKLSHARWLADRLPDSRIETIERARTFVMLDQPARLAELIEIHVRSVEQNRLGAFPDPGSQAANQP